MFRDAAEARAALAALGPSDFVFSLVGYGLGSLALYRALSAGRARYATLMWAALPAAVGPKPPFDARRALNALLMRLPPALVGVRPPAFVVAAGEGAVRRRPPVTAATEVVWAHSLDYDLFLSLPPAAGAARGAVFLDEDVPYHSDYVHLGIPPYSTAERYYPAMSRLFDRVEAGLGAPVTVAAHPRAVYDARPQAYGPRPIVAGRTAELVRDSALVIAHASTSINLAVLYRKPVLLVTTEDLDASPEGALIAAFGTALGRPVWNLDRDAPPLEASVDEEAYARYEACFIKKAGSPRRLFWDIAADRVLA